MSKMRDGHPGAKIFGAAVAELSSSANQKKKKPQFSPPPCFARTQSKQNRPTKQTDILKEPVSVLPKSSYSLDNDILLSKEIEDNYQECAAPDKPSDDQEDYSLPVTQICPPPGFNMPQSTSIDSQYHPIANRFSYTKNDRVCQPPGFSTDLSEYQNYSTQDCLPCVVSAHHSFSSSTVEHEVCNSSPQYYHNVPQRVETASVSMHYPTVYSRSLPYDHDLHFKPVPSDVLEHIATIENESCDLSNQYHPGVSQRSYPTDVSMYHSPRFSMDPSEDSCSLVQHSSYSQNPESQYQQFVHQRSESAEVSPYHSPSSEMFDSEYSIYPSQYHNHHLDSELHGVPRQRSQTCVSQFPSVSHKLEPTDVISYSSQYQYESQHSNYEFQDIPKQRSQSHVPQYASVSEKLESPTYHSAIVPTEYSYFPSQYHQSSEFLDVSRRRSQSCVAPHPSVSQRSEASDVYSFTFIDISNDPDNVLEQATQAVQDLSIDYSLPMKVRDGSQDSGCLSGDEGNSNETPLKDCWPSLSNLPKRTPELSVNKTLKEGPSEVISPHRETNSDSVISGRVSRRSVSRIQGSLSSLSNSSRPTQNVCIARKELNTPMPQYISKDLSDDSGAEVSTDDEADNGKRDVYDSCTGCEEDSKRLIEADSSRQCRLLPDYMRTEFLLCKSDPGFIDSHCHLDFLFQRLDFQGSYSDYRLLHSSTYPVSYEGCVAVFCNPNTFYRKTMWQKFLNEEGVWGTFGCHPHNASLYDELAEKDLCRALEHSKVRALGEIGLDYSNRNSCSREKQHFVLRRQLKIALSKKLPLVIHCRDANKDLMEIMKEMLPKNYFIHLHCFTDDWDWAQKWMSAFPNLFIGITNLVTYNSAEPTHDVVRRIPLDRLLLETDAPYFVPRRIPRSTKYSHPGMAIHVAAQIATLRNIPLKEIIHRTRENTQKMYRL